MLALGVGCTVSLLLVELSFRLFWELPPWLAEMQQAGMYVAAEDDDTPILKAGYRGGMAMRSGEETTVAINSLGMRGAEPRARKDGGRRILVVGDSMVFGYGVDAHEALPSTLQRGLRERGVDAECGNGGVPGCGMVRSAAHLQRLDDPFSADAFVVCSCLGNDALDDTAPRSIIYAGLVFHGVVAQHIQTSWRMRLAMRSRAALWFENWIFTNKNDWSPMAGTLPDPLELILQTGMPSLQQRGACLFMDVKDADMVWTTNHLRSSPIFRVMAQWRVGIERSKRAAGDRPIVLVLLPTMYQVDRELHDDRLRELGFDPARFELGMQQRRLLEVAQELGVRAFDATALLRAQDDLSAYYLSDLGHLSARGNELVGEWLADKVVELVR